MNELIIIFFQHIIDLVPFFMSNSNTFMCISVINYIDP